MYCQPPRRYACPLADGVCGWLYAAWLGGGGACKIKKPPESDGSVSCQIISPASLQAVTSSLQPYSCA